MNKKNKLLLVAVLALSGCASGGAALSLAIVGVAAYQQSDIGSWQVAERAGDPRRPPPMAPDRKVNVVDCTQPIDYSLGNIRCK